MGKAKFDRSRRYVNTKGQTFGRGVWYDEHGKMIKPGQGFSTNDGKVIQYNSDGSTSVLSKKDWHNRKQRIHEYEVLKNDRKWAIPYIPEKKMTITIDKQSPTAKNRGVTLSENLLDSIAANANRAGIPFSTGLGQGLGQQQTEG